MSELPSGSRRAALPPVAPSMDDLPALISGWVPGAGDPSFSSANGKEGEKQMRLHRCSQLFAELESQVHSIIQKKRARHEENRQESLRIALANPLKKPMVQKTVQVETEEVVAEIAPTSAKGNIRMLPLPLSEAVVLQAYKELQDSAAFAVKTCVDCWRRQALTDADLLSTVRGLASSSPALQEAFKAEKELKSEVASAEDFAALAELSRQGSTKALNPFLVV